MVVRPLDDQSDSDVALANVDAIRQAEEGGEEVLGVVGHLNSGQTLAAMDLYKDLPLVVLSATASEQSLTARGYDNFFRVNANDGVQARVDAEFLVDTLKAKRVAVVHNNTEYGQGLAKSFVDELTQRGAEVAVHIGGGGGPEPLCGGSGGRTAGRARRDLLRRLRDRGALPAGRAGGSRRECADAGQRRRLPGRHYRRVERDGGGHVRQRLCPQPASVADDRWFEAYQAVEFRNPDTYSVNGYVAMQVLGEAAQTANTFDREAVAAALREKSFTTILNSLRFEQDGDLVGPADSDLPGGRRGVPAGAVRPQLLTRRQMIRTTYPTRVRI